MVLNKGLVYDTTPEQIEEAMTVFKQIADDHPSTEEATWTAVQGALKFPGYYLKREVKPS